MKVSTKKKKSIRCRWSQRLSTRSRKSRSSRPPTSSSGPSQKNIARYPATTKACSRNVARKPVNYIPDNTPVANKSLYVREFKNPPKGSNAGGWPTYLWLGNRLRLPDEMMTPPLLKRKMVYRLLETSNHTGIEAPATHEPIPDELVYKTTVHYAKRHKIF